MTRAGSKGAALGWGVSVALHASVIVAGTALVWTIERSSDDEAYATEATTVTFYDAGLAPEPVAAEVSTPEVETASALDALFEPAQTDVLATFVTEPESFEPVVERIEAPEPEPLGAAPTRIVREAEFFGTGSSDARRIVYVVDASGSSVAIFPAVARELARSLDGLNATQRAGVIAALGTFGADGSARGVALKASEGLVRMTSNGARRLASWFASEVTPSGRADLLVALREAMALEPDAIFLLATPGGSSASRDGFLGELDAINPVDARTGRRRAMIGVVSVGPPPAGDPLLDIARLHGEGALLVTLERAELLGGN